MKKLHDDLAFFVGQELLKKRGGQILETLYLLEEPRVRQLLWSLVALKKEQQELALRICANLSNQQVKAGKKGVCQPDASPSSNSQFRRNKKNL